MAGNLKHLDDNNFQNEVASGVTLVDFYADWCGPCKMIAPIIEELATEMGGKAKVAKVDIETAQSIAAEYQITSIPTMIIFNDGEVKERFVGIRSKDDLKKALTSHISG